MYCDTPLQRICSSAALHRPYVFAGRFYGISSIAAVFGRNQRHAGNRDRDWDGSEKTRRYRAVFGGVESGLEWSLSIRCEIWLRGEA